MGKPGGKAPKPDAMLRAEIRSYTPKRTKTPKTGLKRLDRTVKWPR